MADPTPFTSNISDARTAITEAFDHAGIPPRMPDILAVSKRQSSDAVDGALAAGHRLFGENRVDEATTRWQERRALYPDLDLHLIGGLQSRKCAGAVALFDCIQSVDRISLADKLKRAMDQANKLVPVFIQVNTGAEPQKGGVMLDDLDSLVTHVRETLGIPLRGLMCLPPVEEEAVLHFALLKKLAARYGLKELSMGMSSDYADAAVTGATLVRIGTALFGARAA